ncbi:MAG: dihydroorotate oxidase, partial [Candidatus Roizmanbacteria bacterium]|nr:dihydroorotate oxidase [Candidatus Roizmanbacteria bacterium]
MFKPIYNPKKTYEENFKEGPFGMYGNQKIYKEKGEPKYEFLGQRVYLPFGIPSGPLINGNYVKAALDKGYDLVEYKDTRTRKYPCHPLPNIVPLNCTGKLTLKKAEKGLVVTTKYKRPISITNSFGVPSMDPAYWQNDLREVVKYAKKGQVVIGGIQGTFPTKGGFKAYMEDFVQMAKLMMETKVKVIELNLSCPNEGVGRLLCH